MVSSASWTASATANGIEYRSRLDEYKETLSRLFPILPKDSVDAWSISEADILALGLLLDCYPQEVTVLDIGTFVGVSAFFFASHPKVTRVVSVDPNPTVADEINDKSEMLDVQIDSEPLRNLKVLDVARAVLAEFPDENRKVQLHEGTVGTDRIGIQEDSSAGPEKLEEPISDPMSDLSAEEPLVAFVDGLHTSRGVQADLEAIFEFNPRAVAILDDCRHTWGPFVQAGVVRFMEDARHEYGFRLLGDLSPATATSNLGIVYPKVDGAEVQRALTDFAGLFTERLDLLRLLRREEELIATVNRYKDAANEAAALQERNSRLEEEISAQRERNSELAERNSEAGEHNTRLKEQRIRLEEQNSQLGEVVGQLREQLSRLTEHRSRIRERSLRLQEQISQLEQRSAELEERSAQLEERNLELQQELQQENAQLAVYRSSRRYKVADTVAQKLRWVPDGLRRTGRRAEQ